MNLFIPGIFITQNEHEQAARSHWSKGAEARKSDTLYVQLHRNVRAALPVTVYPVKVSFVWFRTDKRCDLDNIAFAKKSVLDGLVLAGVLAGDGYKFIQQSQDFYVIDKKNPGVEVTITPL